MKRIVIPQVRRTPKLVIEPLRLTQMLAGNRKIMIAVPEENGSVKIDTMMALMDGQVDRLIRGWAFQIETCKGRPISSARNLLLAKFLASDCTDIAWIDHDIGWRQGAFERLIDHPVDFVAAVPPFRGDAGGFPVRWDSSAANIVADKATGLVKVEGVPFAFVRLTRALVERMVTAYADQELYHPGAPNQTMWRLFHFGVFGRTEWSEDMTFCKMWRDIGGEIWIDPEVYFSHTGEKPFTGCLGDFMRGKETFEGDAAKYLDQKLGQTVEQLEGALT